MIDDRLANRSWLAGAGLQMHQQTRPGVHLDDDAPLHFERL